MSRYILLPTDEFNICKLIPCDGINDQEKQVSLLSELNPFDDVYKKILNKKRLSKLALKISKSKIFVNSNGNPTDGYITLDIDFNNAILDLCNNLYSDYYESFYVMLRKHGIE